MSRKKKVFLTIIAVFVLAISGMFYWAWSKKKAVEEAVAWIEQQGGNVQYASYPWVAKLPESLKGYLTNIVGETVIRVNLTPSITAQQREELRKVFSHCIVFFEWNEGAQAEIEKSDENFLLVVTAYWDATGWLPILAVEKNAAFLNKKRIKCFEADYTRLSKAIEQLLKTYNSIIPLTVFYAKGKAHVLPESYSSEELIKLINDRLEQ